MFENNNGFLLLPANYFVVVVFCLATSACGFQLRQPVNLPPGMNKVYVESAAGRSPIASYLNESINLSGAHVTRDRASADLILNIMNEQISRRAVSLSSTGIANEYELTYVLIYELQLPDGKIIQPKQSIQVIRDYFNPQINVIGKSEEETVIRNEMYREAVRTLLRRTEIALRSDTLTSK